jgi:UPF0716 protein FxsA
MFLALVVIVPLVELFVLAQVSDAVGLANALGVLLLVSLVGLAVVKRQGVAVWRNLRDSLGRHELPSQHLTDGGLLVVAGALLVVPGFVTDAVGLALLVPPVRRLVGRVVVGRRRGRPLAATYRGPIIDTRQTDAPGGQPPTDGYRGELPRS